jgi:hypothetical protein
MPTINTTKDIQLLTKGTINNGDIYIYLVSANGTTAVVPAGTLTINSNGTFNVSGYENVLVNVTEVDIDEELLNQNTADLEEILSVVSNLPVSEE